MERLALLLSSARVSRVRSSAISIDQVSKLTLSDGYALQSQVSSSLCLTHNFEIAGYKVGATSPAVQHKLGLTSPFWGPIFQSAKVIQNSTRGEATRFSLKEDLIRGVEAEFAFEFKKDITPKSTPYTEEELMLEYCSTITPCVEVCASRLLPDVGMLAPMLIADSAGNGAMVFPSKNFAVSASEYWKTVASSKTSIAIDGQVVSQGSGLEVLGRPSLSLQWFVNNVVNGPNQVIVGKDQFVTTGATCGLVPISKPSYVRVSFSGISPCEMNLAFRE